MLYCDKTITFGPDTTGGIRISHASDISEPLEIALTVKRGKRRPFRVEPLVVDNHAPITPDKAQYLRELVAETKSDEAAFLRVAGAPKYEEIGSARYDALVAALHKKVRR